MDPLIIAKLAELAARAKVAAIKAERGQYWDGELSQEMASLSNLAREIAEIGNKYG